MDSRIAAWGLAFEDRAEIVGVDRGLQISAGLPEGALIEFAHRPDVTARVLWVHPEPSAHPEMTASA
ncbi:MAG: hypothetical protein M3Z25_23345 [Actinomycetota bacterium]|nr:hypothetical protein [Actinomycetota bacterium]